jgi:hypothetical protein
MIQKMRSKGHMDTTEFLECQMIYDFEDNKLGGLYAGPICALGGTKIKIGVFAILPRM